MVQSIVPSYFTIGVQAVSPAGGVVGVASAAARSLLLSAAAEPEAPQASWAAVIAAACPPGQSIVYAVSRPGIACIPCAAGHRCTDGVKHPCPPFETAPAGASACVCAAGFSASDGGCVPRAPPCPPGYAVVDALRFPACEPCPVGTWSDDGDGGCHLLLPSAASTACLIIGSGDTCGDGMRRSIDCQCACGPGTEWRGANETCAPCPNGTRSSSVGRAPCTPVVAPYYF